MRPWTSTCCWTVAPGLSLSPTLMVAEISPGSSVPAVIFALAFAWPIQGCGTWRGRVRPKNVELPSTAVSGGAIGMALAETFVFTLYGGGMSLVFQVPAEATNKHAMLNPRERLIVIPPQLV